MLSAPQRFPFPQKPSVELTSIHGVYTLREPQVQSTQNADAVGTATSAASFYDRDLSE